MKQDILLVGTGALATLFAARLSEAGHSVSMLGTWKQALQTLRENGYDHIYLHQIGPDQEGFFKFFKNELLPLLEKEELVQETI